MNPSLIPISVGLPPDADRQGYVDRPDMTAPRASLPLDISKLPLINP
jgi:hypothetical protein